MESEWQPWMFFAGLFLVAALRARPAWGGRRGRAILEYALAFYCIFFVGIYAVTRIVEPGSLVQGAVLRDGFLWWTAAAATAGTLAGSLFGSRVRQAMAGRNLDPGDVRYRLAEPSVGRSSQGGAPDHGAAKQDGHPAD